MEMFGLGLTLLHQQGVQVIQERLIYSHLKFQIDVYFFNMFNVF